MPRYNIYSAENYKDLRLLIVKKNLLAIDKLSPIYNVIYFKTKRNSSVTFVMPFSKTDTRNNNLLALGNSTDVLTVGAF